MASYVSYDFEPNTDVYVINECNGSLYVASGVVLRVRIAVLVTTTTVVYDIRLNGDNTTTEFAQSAVFADKPTAIAAYSNIIT